MDIEVTIDPGAWDGGDAISEDIGAAVAAALAAAGATDTNVELTVVLMEDGRAATYNQRYRDKPGPTNVLSFPAGPLPGLPAGETRPLGDLILATGVIRREAAEQGKSVADHLAHLVVHGTLHLLGHDHDTDENAEQMQRVEDKALNQLDIAPDERNYRRAPGA